MKWIKYIGNWKKNTIESIRKNIFFKKIHQPLWRLLLHASTKDEMKCGRSWIPGICLDSQLSLHRLPVDVGAKHRSKLCCVLTQLVEWAQWERSMWTIFSREISYLLNFLDFSQHFALKWHFEYCAKIFWPKIVILCCHKIR